MSMITPTHASHKRFQTIERVEEKVQFFISFLKVTKKNITKEPKRNEIKIEFKFKIERERERDNFKEIFFVQIIVKMLCCRN